MGAIASSFTIVSMLFQFIRSGIQFISMALILTRLHWLAAVAIVVLTAPQMLSAAYYARQRFAMNFDLTEDTRMRH